MSGGVFAMATDRNVIDPITLAVVKGALENMAEEMDHTLAKTAFSPTISEGHDRANGLYHPRTGEVIVQGATGLPIFIGVMQFTTQAVIERIKQIGCSPGDIFLVNDPYSGGTHLMDVKMVKPFFYRGELFGYLSNTGHWPDMGGSVPGGFGTKNTEAYQEGLRIPPVRLFHGGEIDDDLLTILMSNIRVPDERYGDLQAQVSALHVGETRLTEILDKYGKETVWACIEELRVRAERQMRAYAQEIPDGCYTYEDYLDSDGIEDVPLKLALDMTVRGDTIHFDFSRSSPPCRGPMNSVIATTISACYIALWHIFPDVPVNAGAFQPFSFHIPKTTFLNASLPRPVAGCAAEVSQRVVDTVFGAMGKAIPARLFGTPFGTVNNITIGGTDELVGPYIMYMFNGGGYGGSKELDGLTYGAPTISISKTQPYEVFEQRYPVLFRQFAIRENSGGVGAHRGGFGAVIELELSRGEAMASFIGDRGRFGPPGMLGGGPGAKCEVTIYRQSKKYVPPHLTKDERVLLRGRVSIQKGDVVQLKTPGGGGYGDPLARDPSLVLRDVQHGYISRRAAKQDYGVVIRGAKIDWPATAALRSTLRAADHSDREGHEGSEGGRR
jgi:N-methylhydantoinase B